MRGIGLVWLVVSFPANREQSLYQLTGFLGRRLIDEGGLHFKVQDFYNNMTEVVTYK